jgi:hypothetical protein
VELSSKWHSICMQFYSFKRLVKTLSSVMHFRIIIVLCLCSFCNGHINIFIALHYTGYIWAYTCNALVFFDGVTTSRNAQRVAHFLRWRISQLIAAFTYRCVSSISMPLHSKRFSIQSPSKRLLTLLKTLVFITNCAVPIYSLFKQFFPLAVFLYSSLLKTLHSLTTLV